MVPKYLQVAANIESDIIGHVYQETNKLLTEEEYSTKYQVSRNTIRKAIEILVNKGYVYQVQGSGAFIRHHNRGYVNLEKLQGVTNDFKEEVVENELIDFRLITADQELAQHMGCKTGTNIYFVKRLRYVNGNPFSIETSHFNKDLVRYLDENIVNNSIYTYLRNDQKLAIGFADRVIRADYLSDEQAHLLGLKEKDPALVVDNTVYLTNGAIFDYSESVHHFEHVKLLKVSNMKGN